MEVLRVIEARGGFMGKIYPLAVLWMSIFLSACVGFRVAGEVQKGRMELLYGDPSRAVTHFREATELKPDYSIRESLLTQGVWTYLGRAYYNQGKLTEAQESLERAQSQGGDDYLAMLYLGLTFARQGDQRSGLREIEAGLKRLGEWLDYIYYYHPDGRFWDPTRRIRSEIHKDLEMMSGKDVHWPQLISSGEWLGRAIEEEMDRVREDRLRERRDRDRRRRTVLTHR